MRTLLSLIALAALAALAPARAQDAPVIAAAADLQVVLPEIAKAFKSETGREVTLVFGSSGKLTQQIQSGAPFQMLMAADESFVFKLADAGKTFEGARGDIYAQGHIGLFVPLGSALQADAKLDDLEAALRDGRVKHLAIANPDHAPYGRAAMQALQHRGLWDAAKPLLVLGENVSQTMQFASSGSAEGGLVPLSLAASPALAPLGRFAPIPEEWYAPLRQRMVVLAGAGETTRAFYAYVKSPPARALFIKAGFGSPGESS